MRSTYLPLLFVYALCLPAGLISAQSALVLRIDTATVDPGCGDLLGNPEPMWGVNVNGEGYVYYPQDGPCFQALPHDQYFTTASCPADLPARV